MNTYQPRVSKKLKASLRKQRGKLRRRARVDFGPSAVENLEASIRGDLAFFLRKQRRDATSFLEQEERRLYQLEDKLKRYALIQGLSLAKRRHWKKCTLNDTLDSQIPLSIESQAEGGDKVHNLPSHLAGARRCDIENYPASPVVLPHLDSFNQPPQLSLQEELMATEDDFLV